MSRAYDGSWNCFPGDPGYSEKCEGAFEKKLEEWEFREWLVWLTAALSFPFAALREEEWEKSEENPAGAFGVGQDLEVLGIEAEDVYGEIIVRVRQANHWGKVPLCELEVTDKANANYWPVREYSTWVANR